MYGGDDGFTGTLPVAISVFSRGGGSADIITTSGIFVKTYLIIDNQRY